ncbi:MAG TPA: diguanylate cyclase, partial [Pararobbsia sp.]|nr:diguanylate cyclase [Pararobbsia sp.]
MTRATAKRSARSADRSTMRRRSLLAIPLLGILLLGLLWIVILSRLQVEKEASYRESSASAAILSAALEQHTIKAIHQVDQITRFVKYEFEKSPDHFDLRSTVDKGVVQSDTLIQISLIDKDGKLIATTADADPRPVDLSDREHFLIHKRENDDQLFISTPVLGRISKHWTLQITRRLNYPDGSFAGVVVVSEDPAYFTNDFYNNAAIGKDGVISVVSDSGVILARRTGSTPQTPGTFSAAGTYPTGRHVSGVYDDPIDGVSRIVSYRHIDGYPLGVMVGLSEAEELADYHHTRNVYLMMGAFITLALIAFFGVSTGLIAKLLGREREMIDLVEYDVLTELPNRYHTLKMLRSEVGQVTNVGRLALLFIDLDNFKTVNDTLGHNAGDAVLQMTATRLEDTVGDAGVLARIGGDEFVVVMRGDHVEEAATRLAESIERTLREPFDVQGSAFVLQASIGIALHTVADESEIDLLKKADLAMYSAKDAGKGCYAFYSPALSHRADHLMKWEQQLRVALSEGQLFLAYQPKIDLAHKCIAGFEALVR